MRSARFALMDTGDRALERGVVELSHRCPQAVVAHIGYDEPLAHLPEAGSDLFVMPSRFEPCGLNQMYSMRYGTPPVVRDTGGFADTVVDAGPDSLAAGRATGFVFDEPSVSSLVAALERAVDGMADPATRATLMRAGMSRQFDWDRSARRYQALYRWRAARTK